ncbi:hypothetical protein IZY60_00600 [Lutibacter sp. B2]|nr:hypothetical protein [Lutibacter sp. B2]
MDLDKLEIGTEEKILRFVFQDSIKNEMNVAKQLFYKEMDQLNISDVMMVDFNDWLIYDYKMADEKTFIQKFFDMKNNELSDSEKLFIKEKCQSYLSIYELKELQGDFGIFEDIFMKNEVRLKSSDFEQMKEHDLIFSRIISISEEYKAIGEITYIPEMLKKTIERNVVVKYQENKEKYKFVSWKDFLRENSFLLYKYVAIIGDLINREVEDEEEYDVWQSVYLIKDMNKIKDIFEKEKNILLEFKENKMSCFNLFEDEELLANIVVDDNRLEIECDSKEMRTEVKEKIEKKLGELIHHYKDETIKFEDLI